MGLLLPAQCSKARMLTNPLIPKVPHNAPECRHFEFNLDAPAE